MTLKDCTKEELIYMVNYIAGRVGVQNKDYYIKLALGEVAYSREKKKLDRAEELNQLSARKRNEYINLMKQYGGKSGVDVPLDVFKKALALLEEAQKADKEWEKIMKEVDANYET